MRKYATYALFISTITFLFIAKVNGQGVNADSLRIDSLFNSINKQPSDAEVKWVISQLQQPISKSDSSNLLPWITALTAIIGFFLQRRWQLKKDRLAMLYNSLQWFEGRTQKRSLGIAMIEANWDKEKDFHRTWMAVLTNQAVYLLRQSKQGNSAHEIENLKRIMQLLIVNKENILKSELKQIGLAVNDSFKREGKPKEIVGSKDGYGLDLSYSSDRKELNDWGNIFPIN